MVTVRQRTMFIFFSWSLFALAHGYFVAHSSYWYIEWLDLLMHTWGGLLLILSWYFIHKVGLFPIFFKHTLAHPLLFLVAAMAGWEVFKYAISSIVSDAYVLDTVLDLTFGALGGLIGFWLFRSRTMK